MSSIDLPPNIAAQLQLETVGNIQGSNNRNRGVSDAAMGVLQGAMARKHDEIGPIESRAVGAVMATPIASPTTQSGT